MQTLRHRVRRNTGTPKLLHRNLRFKTGNNRLGEDSPPDSNKERKWRKKGQRKLWEYLLRACMVLQTTDYRDHHALQWSLLVEMFCLSGNILLQFDAEKLTLVLAHI